MKMIYIGGGYVGACSAAVSADSGHEVLVYDVDKEKVKNLSSNNKDIIEFALFEDGLGELITRNKARINFSSSYVKVESMLDEARVVFMCLPTPEKGGSGETDMSYYESAAKELAVAMAKRNNGKQTNYVLIINKSTVPIETIGLTEEIMKSAGVKNFGVGSNPEFLVEGKAIDGSIKPSRIVVGAWKERDFKIFREAYNRFYNNTSVSFIETNPIESAAGKLLANYILFNRLANTFDVVGRTCESFDKIKYEKVKSVIVSDNRIGDWGFFDSLFAGGSCFIKDSRSLAHQLSQRGQNVDLVNNTLLANERQLNNFLWRAETDLSYKWEGKKIGLLGLAFKRDTNDVRNSPALTITDYLADKGIAEIRAYDPVASDNYLKHYEKNELIKKITVTDNEIDAIKGMDVIIIVTDWPQFRGLNDVIKENLPVGALVMDGRRMLQHKFDELAEAGYAVLSVGSPILKK